MALPRVHERAIRENKCQVGDIMRELINSGLM